MKTIRLLTICGVLLCAVVAMPMQLRVKDLAELNSGGDHTLIGYGLVVGLQGTGDGSDATFTVQALANMLAEFGVTVEPGQMEVDNVAAIIATAKLPPDTPVGATVDVTVSSLGDAESLQGGTLLITPLTGADKQVYAIAQGAVSIGGYNAGTSNAQVRQNHAAVGTVPNGASVVRSVNDGVGGGKQFVLTLHQPDFTTANRLARTINANITSCTARAVSASTVRISPGPQAPAMVDLITRVEALPVTPDAPARVVINERTGTVVMGSHVRILPVAVAHGNLTVRVQREYEVSQPPPLISHNESDNTIIAAGNPRKKDHSESAESAPSQQPSDASDVQGANGKGPADTSAGRRDAPDKQSTDATADMQDASGTGKRGRGIMPGGGRTVVVPEDTVQVQQEDRQLMQVGGEASLQDLVEGLNALGVSPRDLIAIIEALKDAGALQAELVVQ